MFKFKDENCFYAIYDKNSSDQKKIELTKKKTMTLDDDEINTLRQLWRYLHRRSFDIEYADEPLKDQRHGFIKLLWALTEEMSCSHCRYHLNKYLQEHPLSLETNLARYVVDLHNNVNKRQHKRIIPFEVAEDYYVNGNMGALCPAVGRCSLPQMSPVHVGLIVTGIIVIVLVILLCAYWQHIVK